MYGHRPRRGQTVASYSGSYPLKSMKLMAQGAARAAARWLQDRDDPRRPRAHSAAWVLELAQSLQFEPVVSYNFTRSQHINCLESRAFKTMVKILAKRHEGTRSVCLGDSQVQLGSPTRGRSSSPSLSVIQQSSLGYLLGGGLYPCGIYTESKHHPADDPTRGVQLRQPTRLHPRWLAELLAGSSARFDLVVQADSLRRPYCYWARFVLLLGAGPSLPVP